MKWNKIERELILRTNIRTQQKQGDKSSNLYISQTDIAAVKAEVRFPYSM